MASHGIKIILFAFLAVVILTCHTFIDRYEKSGPERLNLLELDGKITSQRSLKYASDLRSMSYKKELPNQGNGVAIRSHKK